MDLTEPDWARERKKLIYSMDLQEATYSMSWCIMEINEQLMDLAMKKFSPWKVYNELFKIHSRDVDFSVLKEQGYYPEEYPDILATRHGCFMGDALSFIHLTMMLSSIVDQTVYAESKDSSRHVFQAPYIKRPIGQSVGDDLILLGIDQEFADRMHLKTKDMGLKISKIDSVSEDSGTFCENYVFRPHSLHDLKTSPPKSTFGDLLFLDVIKGNLLTGKSKIKSDNSDPFIGHAKMLNKQIEYLPPTFNWKARRAKLVLWIRNYKKAVKLGRSKPHLPEALGGLDIAVGNCDAFDSQLMSEKYVPYWCGMLKLDREKFLEYWILLNGIYRQSPKGFPWSNNEEIIAKVVSKAEIAIDEVDIFPHLPSWLSEKPIGDKLRYINQKLGYISVRQIADELSRREAFLNFWERKTPKTFMTLNVKDAKQRHNDVWKHIRQTVQPEPPPQHIFNFKTLKLEFEIRTWGLYIKRSDPAIAEAFKNTPSMYIWLKNGSFNHSF